MSKEVRSCVVSSATMCSRKCARRFVRAFAFLLIPLARYGDQLVQLLVARHFTRRAAISLTFFIITGIVVSFFQACVMILARLPVIVDLLAFSPTFDSTATVTYADAPV